jgi:tetratricopeptide (TPR) repeat protein
MTSLNCWPSERPPALRFQLLLFFGLFLLAVAVYLPTLSFSFVYDDHVQVVESRYTKSWLYVPRYFSEHLWAETYGTEVRGNFYRPVFQLWLLVNYKLFGLSAPAWHLAAALLQAAVSVLAALLAWRVTSSFAFGFSCGLLFAVHPVHLESVAWISGAGDPLAAAFLIAAFLAHLERRAAANLCAARCWLAASLFLGALAMLAKESGAVFPLLVLAWEWTASRPAPAPADSKLQGFSSAGWKARARDSLRASAPALVLLAAYLALRYVVLGGFSHGRNLALPTLLFTLPGLLVSCLKLLFWPVALSPFYDSPDVEAFTLRGVLLPLLLLLAAAALLCRWAARDRAAAAGIAWLAIPLLPLLNLRIFPQNQLLHNRYVYLSSLGACMLAAAAIRVLPAGRKSFAGLSVTRLAAVAALAALGSYFTLTQLWPWRDDAALFTYGHQRAPNDPLVANYFANIVFDQGRAEEAIRILEQTLARQPDFYTSLYNIGRYHYLLGHYPAAEEYFRRGVRAEPRDPAMHAFLGRCWLRLGRIDDAVRAIEQAARLRPRDPAYRFALGIALRQAGRQPEALEAFRAALALDPGMEAARLQIAEIESALRSPRPPD